MSFWLMNDLNRSLPVIDIRRISDELTAICDHYELSAPTVHAWANDLYIRIGEQPNDVTLAELMMVARFREDGIWMQPNYAANYVYRKLHQMGRDTTGQIGF